jgi:hypothetical protein
VAIVVGWLFYELLTSIEALKLELPIVSRAPHALIGAKRLQGPRSHDPDPQLELGQGLYSPTNDQNIGKAMDVRRLSWLAQAIMTTRYKISGNQSADYTTGSTATFYLITAQGNIQEVDIIPNCCYSLHSYIVCNDAIRLTQAAAILTPHTNFSKQSKPSLSPYSKSQNSDFHAICCWGIRNVGTSIRT